MSYGGGSTQTVAEFRMERVEFDVNGVRNAVEVRVPTDLSPSQTTAFRDLLLKVEQALSKNELQDLTLGEQDTKNVKQDDKLKVHDAKLGLPTAP